MLPALLSAFAAYLRMELLLCTGGSHNIKEDIIAEAALKAIQAQIALVENMAEVIKEINSAPTRIRDRKSVV